MKRIVASFITGMSLLSPLAAAAAPADSVKLGNVLTSATLCEGVRLDRVMTYDAFLREYALDLKAQDAILSTPGYGLEENQLRLATAKYERYVVTSRYVKNAQKALCGAESSNWTE